MTNNTAKLVLQTIIIILLQLQVVLTTNRKLAIILFLTTVVLLVVAAIFMTRKNNQAPTVEVNSYEDCVAAGYPVMESYPEQCKTPDGRNFTRDISAEPTPSEDEMIFCTMDAKVCPDGSSVGRVPPSCEFAPCPGN